MPGHEIVAIGASAGGVEALGRLARGLPPDLHAAVFVTLHVPPSQPSMLPHILSRAGPLAAAHARDGEPIQHGRIYVAPPNQHLVVARGRVRLSQAPRADGFRPAINVLLRTAAWAYGASVVGVLLSGALHDGTAGLAMVKARGGIAVLQDPSETLYPQMPSTAMKHVDVDYVLPVAEIPPLLARLARTPVTAGPRDERGTPAALPASSAEEATVETVANGMATGFVCPECGGSLWEAFHRGLIHYHCHIGHVFSVDGLLAGQADTVERALGAAARALQERAALSLRVARRVRETGDDATARRLETRARTLEERAALVQRTLEEVLKPESAQEQ